MVQNASPFSASPELDAPLREFLRDKVNSFVKWDLIRFFHDNPHAMETAENIAQFTGRDTRSVEAALHGLVGANVLRAKKANDHIIFSLANDPETRDLVNQFVASCDDRQFRVMAINQFLGR